MTLSDDVHAVSGLFGDAVEQLSKVVQNDVHLAKAELAQKIAQAALGAAYVGAAAMLCVPVLVLILIALALCLVQLGWNPAIAYLAAGGFGTIACGILAILGMRYLKPENLKPKVIIRELHRDVATAKELAR